MDKINYNEHNITTLLPIWIRLPKQGSRCPHTGLSRGVMHRLVAPCKENSFSPPVKSKQILKDGKKRGVRLVDFQSLVTFISESGDEDL